MRSAVNDGFLSLYQDNTPVTGAADVPIGNSLTVSQAMVSDEYVKKRALAWPFSLFRMVLDKLIQHLRVF